jgi:hypothetical protein
MPALSSAKLRLGPLGANDAVALLAEAGLYDLAVTVARAHGLPLDGVVAALTDRAVHLSVEGEASVMAADGLWRTFNDHTLPRYVCGFLLMLQDYPRLVRNLFAASIPTGVWCRPRPMEVAAAVASPHGVCCAACLNATTRPQPTSRLIYLFSILVCSIRQTQTRVIGWQLHTVAVERVLSMQVGAGSFALPLWLTAALTARAPAVLLALYVDHEHIPEAVQLAIDVINAQVGGYLGFFEK